MNIGLVLRCFEKDPSKVNARVQEINETLQRIEESCKKWPQIGCCIILIPINKDFKDYDCGLTGKNLLAGSNAHKFPSRYIVAETNLDIFACAVNSAALHLSRLKCDEMLIVSSSCRSYITEANMDKLLRAPDAGARVAGLVIADSPEIMELQRRGSIMNTFALWHIDSFLTVGGMNPAEGNPRVDRNKNRYVQTKNGPIPFAGLETTTLYHMGMTFGRCIAPVVPVDQGVWRAPDPEKDPEGAHREKLKRESKVDRHSACFQMEGYRWEELSNFLLPGYPK